MQNDTKILFRFHLESIDYFWVYGRGDELEILAMIIEGDVRMKVKAYIASAFSKDNAGGNRAGIIFLQKLLSVTQKIAIAKELGFSESAFISNSEQADFKFEYYTPTSEVDLCGHATIASFTLMRELGKVVPNQYTIETKAGIIPIEVQPKRIFMKQQPSEFFEKIEKPELSEAIDISAVNDNFDIQVVSKGGKDILVPVNINDLNALNPNWQAIATLSEQYGVIGMHVFGLSETDIVCRSFAPLYGINEESATSTSSGALACYLFTKKIRCQKEYVFHQGANLGSASEIVVKLPVNQQDEIIGVNVGGAGYVSDVKFLEVV